MLGHELQNGHDILDIGRANPMSAREIDENFCQSICHWQICGHMGEGHDLAMQGGGA